MLVNKEKRPRNNLGSDSTRNNQDWVDHNNIIHKLAIGASPLQISFVDLSRQHILYFETMCAHDIVCSDEVICSSL
jgi:hypothetical protein